MLKSLNSKFYLVVVALFLLYGISYGILAYFLHHQGEDSKRVQVAMELKNDIATLNESFNNARLWEKVILYQSLPEAEKNFGDFLHKIRSLLFSFYQKKYENYSQDNFRRILFNINSYEVLIADIIQLKTKEKLIDTQLVANFQSITSSILQFGDPELMRPLHGATQFFIQYQNTSEISQFKALEIVMLSLKEKCEQVVESDEKLKVYLSNFISVLEEDHVIGERILLTGNEIETISMNLSRDITESNEKMDDYIHGLIETSNRSRVNLKRMFLLSTFIGTLFLLCILVLIKNSIIGPVANMARVMSRVKNGDMSARFEPLGRKNDEIYDMGLSLNTMLESIEQRDRTLLEYQVKLEEQLHELSKQKKEQELLTLQLKRVEKMEAVGALAGGVAHDLNNILSGVVSYPELLLLDMPDENPYKKPLLVIQDSGKRAVAIVQDLLTLARRGAAVLEIININHLVQNYLASPEFKKLSTDSPNITFNSDLAENINNIRGSRAHLMKTLMNLVTNGAESIKKEGGITLTTGNTYLSEPFGEYKDVVEGEYVSLVVADTGEGISTSDLVHIFEPFFTRKEMGRSGTGLGLTVVWSTVTDHKGYIKVTSDEQGTVFTLYFPVTAGEVQENTIEKPVETYIGQGEMILVVDDVEYQREIGLQMLEKLGYRVATAASGEEAVAFVRENRVDLLVLDMLMPPGIDGLETYRQILDLYPDMKAIIVSGYSESERVFEAQRLGSAVYIRKPYSLETIGEAVKKELTE